MLGVLLALLALVVDSRKSRVAVEKELNSLLQMSQAGNLSWTPNWSK